MTIYVKEWRSSGFLYQIKYILYKLIHCEAQNYVSGQKRPKFSYSNSETSQNKTLLRTTDRKKHNFKLSLKITKQFNFW